MTKAKLGLSGASMMSISGILTRKTTKYKPFSQINSIIDI